MPTSHYYQISKIVEIMSRLRPRSVLDVGIGYGKYGVLGREFLEMGQHLERKVRIDGIEIFPNYITAGQRFYYDEIFIGNALDRIPMLGNYDLILIVDVLEHFAHDEGIKLLDNCVQKGSHVLVSTPLDIGDQGAVYDNEHERHRSQWKKRHFKYLGPVTFFWNHHALLCLIGPNGNQVKRAMKTDALKIKVRSYLPALYLFYRKHIRKFFVRL